MGVIKSQSIKHSIITYLGVVIGTANLFLIYPLALDQAQLGLIRFLTDVAFIFTPFILLGANSIAIRFYPQFRNEENGHNGLLALISLITLVGFLLFLAIYYAFKPQILSFWSNASPLLDKYLFLIVPTTFAVVYSSLYTNYASNFHRIAIPQAILNSNKLLLPALALLYYFGYIVFDWVAWGLMLSYFLMLLLSIFYLYWLGEWNLRFNLPFITKPMAKKMAEFAGYGVLGGLGTTFVTRVDTVMITAMTTLAKTGIYSIPSLMASVIEVPTKAVNNISAPIIAAAWRENNKQEIQSIYQKSSLNLLIVGVLLFILAWASIDDLYAIIPNGEEYISGKYAFFWLGLSKIFDMATGVNNQVIGYSKYFKFNFYTVIVLAIFTVLTNLWLIPIYDIVGAALASAASMAIYNFAKFAFIWWKFDLQPFSWRTLAVVGIAPVAYFPVMQLPAFGDTTLSIVVHIAVASALITLIFGALIYAFKISTDINGLVNQLMSTILKTWKRK